MMMNEFAAMLMAKLYMALAGFTHHANGAWGGMMLDFNDDTRTIKVRIDDTWHVLVEIPDGKTPDEWIADGRRNWRTIRKFADGIKSAALAADIEWMFGESTEGTLLGDVDALEDLLEDADESGLIWLEDMIEPAFDRDRAEQLQPNHPLFERYDALIIRAKEFINHPEFEAKKAAKQQRDAEAAEAKRIEDRTEYVMNQEVRREADARVARSNAFIQFGDYNEDLRQMFAEGYELWEIIEAI